MPLWCVATDSTAVDRTRETRPDWLLTTSRRPPVRALDRPTILRLGASSDGSQIRRRPRLTVAVQSRTDVVTNAIPKLALSLGIRLAPAAPPPEARLSALAAAPVFTPIGAQNLAPPDPPSSPRGGTDAGSAGDSGDGSAEGSRGISRR